MCELNAPGRGQEWRLREGILAVGESDRGVEEHYLKWAESVLSADLLGAHTKLMSASVSAAPGVHVQGDGSGDGSSDGAHGELLCPAG